MKKSLHIFGVFALVTLPLYFSSCLNETFIDIEPKVDSTIIEANTTIAELKSIYNSNLLQLNETTFNDRDSIFIEGIVTSDDKSGNFYKSIVIQDVTGGIEIKLDKTNLYNDYRLGQRVVVVCNNLYLGDFGGIVQIGSAYTVNGVKKLGGIEGEIIINKHVLRKGKILVPVTPLIFQPSDLTASNLSKLVKVDEVEFLKLTSTETGIRLTFANKAKGLPLDHPLDVCGQTLTNFVLRSGGYSKFANDTIPSLKGSITGILSYDNGTYLLIIRDLNDINLVNSRCNAPL